MAIRGRKKNISSREFELKTVPKTLMNNKRKGMNKKKERETKARLKNN